ncbi:MAG: thiol reductase thioredoxin [Deltaproteobacteria bacterium]|nr:thiol reductase thioredoxin [Deltaproteobacteria bacterium]MBW2082984.1 thiol reductase thioredoxin [Deltaproteobacteria bacterium]RLB83687.1 MAG: thiol reductase thioredoxin [Deltaproteobacteria bacterium]HDM10034.1 thiol reductase thioredoxin [Desulfobacteraceae bacterium]
MGVKTIKSKKEFYRSIGQGVVLVNFHAPWCAPCRLLEPIIDKIASTFKDRVFIHGLNVDEHEDLALNLEIHHVPTLIIFKEGREVERIIGLQEEIVLSEALNRALEGSAATSDSNPII